MMITTLLQRATIASLICLSATAQEDSQRIRVLHKAEAEATHENARLRTVTLDLTSDLEGLEETLKSLGAQIDVSVGESISAIVEQTGQSNERGYLGVSLELSENGAKIISLMPGSGAGKAGLEVGDVIQRIADVEAVGEDFLKQLKGLAAGDSVLVHVTRGDHHVEAKVLLATLGQVQAEPVHEDDQWVKRLKGADGKLKKVLKFRSGDGGGEHKLYPDTGAGAEVHGKIVIKLGDGNSEEQIIELDLEDLEGMGAQFEWKGLKGLKGLHKLKGKDQLYWSEFDAGLEGMLSDVDVRVMVIDDDEGDTCSKCKKAKPSKKRKEKRSFRRRISSGGDHSALGELHEIIVGAGGGGAHDDAGEIYEIIIQAMGFDDFPGDAGRLHEIILRARASEGHHGDSSGGHHGGGKGMRQFHGFGGSGHGDQKQVEITVEVDEDGPRAHGRMMRNRVMEVPGCCKSAPKGDGGGHSFGWSTTPPDRDHDGGLVEELRALRKELAGLRKDISKMRKHMGH